MNSLVMTGASSGIGSRFLHLAKEHFQSITTLGRALIEPIGPGHLHFSLDMKKLAGPQLVDWQKPSKLDALILCAGSDAFGRNEFLEKSFENWEETIQVNFLRNLEMIHLLLPKVLASNLKTILVISSMNIEAPPKGCLAYTAAKSAMRSVLENLRLEYSYLGLRVIEICPSITKTNFAYNRLQNLESAEKFYDSFTSVLSADSVANAMLWSLKQDLSVSVTKIEIQPTRLAK